MDHFAPHFDRRMTSKTNDRIGDKCLLPLPKCFPIIGNPSNVRSSPSEEEGEL